MVAADYASDWREVVKPAQLGRKCRPYRFYSVGYAKDFHGKGPAPRPRDRLSGRRELATGVASSLGCW